MWEEEEPFYVAGSERRLPFGCRYLRGKQVWPKIPRVHSGTASELVIGRS